jgi:hypothetical protein
MIFFHTIGSPALTQKWNQAAINRAMEAYHESPWDHEMHCETLWCLIKDEVLGYLRMELKNDIAVEEAEFASRCELNRRLKVGTVKFLTKVYVRKYICGRGMQFIRNRPIQVDFEADDSPFKNFADSRPGPDDAESVRYADLYFCFEKLTDGEKRMVKLHLINEMRLDEVAALMKMSHDAVRKQNSRAMDKLKLCLEKFGTGGWS